MDHDEEDLARLFGRPTKIAASHRRAKELRSPPPSDRRAMRTGEKKEAQINLKVRPAFKASFTAAAVSERLSMAEFLEKLYNAYMERDQ